MALQVVSRKDGFRRGGLVHSGSKVYPKGSLTKVQERQIRDEPMLVCTEVPEPKGAETTELADKNEKTSKKDK